MKIWGPARCHLALKALVQPGTLNIGTRLHIEWGAQIHFRRGSLTVGDNVRIKSGAVVDVQHGSVIIGSNVSFNPYSVVLGAGVVEIGKDVRIAAHAVIVSFDHNFDDVNRPIRSQGITKKPVVIGDDVWLGAGAKVLGGAKVGRGCVIAAGAVVKGETEPYGIYGGIPARKIGSRLPAPYVEPSKA